MWLGSAVFVVRRVHERQLPEVWHKRVLCLGLQNRHAVVPLIKRTEAFPTQAVIESDLPTKDELVLEIVCMVQLQAGGARIDRQRVGIYPDGAVSEKERCK